MEQCDGLPIEEQVENQPAVEDLEFAGVSDEDIQATLKALEATAERKRNIENIKRLREADKKQRTGPSSSSSSSSGIDASALSAATTLAALANHSGATTANLDSFDRKAPDHDGNLLSVSRKNSFLENMNKTTAARRMMDRRRWEACLSEGGTVVEPEKVLREVKARSYEHVENMHLLTGSPEELAKIDPWVSTAVFRLIKNFPVVTDQVVLTRFLNGELPHNDNSLLSLYHTGPITSAGNNFDRLEHDVAIRLLVERITGWDNVMATFNSVLFLSSSKEYIDRVTFGDLNLRYVPWLRFEYESVLYVFFRHVGRRIFDNAGAEVRVTSIGMVIEIFKKLLRAVDTSKVREETFRTHWEISARSPKKDVPAKGLSGSEVIDKAAAEKAAAEKTDRDSRKTLKEKSRKAKEAADAAAIKSKPATTTTGSTGTFAGVTRAKHGVCVLHLAETSGLFTGVKCTYGDDRCAFEHKTVLSLKKPAAMAALQRGQGKVTPEQSTALEAFIESNCL